VIQHVTLEVTQDQIDPCLAFYTLLGFRRIEPPPALADRTAWLERGPTQLHLMVKEDAPQDRPGHFAVVANDHEATLQSLREAGHEPDPRDEHWGSPRAFVMDPAGNRVEVMAFAPSS